MSTWTVDHGSYRKYLQREFRKRIAQTIWDWPEMSTDEKLFYTTATFYCHFHHMHGNVISFLAIYKLLVEPPHCYAQLVPSTYHQLVTWKVICLLPSQSSLASRGFVSFCFIYHLYFLLFLMMHYKPGDLIFQTSLRKCVTDPRENRDWIYLWDVLCLRNSPQSRASSLVA